MSLTTEETDRITAIVNDRKNKPRKTDVLDDKGLLVQTIEISEDNLIVVVKTNPFGM